MNIDDIKREVLKRIKEKYKNYIVCYCHNIYLDDIVKIVKNTNESNLTKKDIFVCSLSAI